MGDTYPKTVTKPWGKEVWLYLGRYCFKYLEIRVGTRTSLQWHREKHETNFIVSGELEFWSGPNQDHLVMERKGPGDSFLVEPPTVHRIVALTDIVLLEASTPEVDDVKRIQDDTGRGDGRIDSEHKSR